VEGTHKLEAEWLKAWALHPRLAKALLLNQTIDWVRQRMNKRGSQIEVPLSRSFGDGRMGKRASG
jgi:hypothetical protein